MVFNNLKKKLASAAVVVALTGAALQAPSAQAEFTFEDALKTGAYTGIAYVGSKLVATGVTTLAYSANLFDSAADGHAWSHVIKKTIFVAYMTYQAGSQLYTRYYAVDPDTGVEEELARDVVQTYAYSGVELPLADYQLVASHAAHVKDGVPHSHGKTCMQALAAIFALSPEDYAGLNRAQTAQNFCKDARALAKTLRAADAAVEPAPAASVLRVKKTAGKKAPRKGRRAVITARIELE